MHINHHNAEVAFRQGERIPNGRFHSDWLSMMYPRLKLARNLLADDGAIFVSIDSTEHANLTRLLIELMGEENFRANIVWQKRYTRSNNTKDFTAVVENIVVFSRSDQFAVNPLPPAVKPGAMSRVESKSPPTSNVAVGPTTIPPGV